MGKSKIVLPTADEAIWEVTVVQAWGYCVGVSTYGTRAKETSMQSAKEHLKPFNKNIITYFSGSGNFQCQRYCLLIEVKIFPFSLQGSDKGKFELAPSAFLRITFEQRAPTIWSRARPDYFAPSDKNS
jgi:hypothetical protein